MNINIYSQELTSEVIELVRQDNRNIAQHAAQMILNSDPKLLRLPDEEIKSAITFWLPITPGRREAMAKAFERIAEIFRTAP